LTVYVDTSFLVSLYALDSKSALAVTLMSKSPDRHIISSFAELETRNALQLRVFRKEIAALQAKASWEDFQDDVRSGVFELRALPDRAFERAHELSQKTTARLGTRTADLLHVAAALEMDADCLYSFDQQQRKLAQAVRLKINP
jgi:predicted nucleic acid-binding protein